MSNIPEEYIILIGKVLRQGIYQKLAETHLLLSQRAAHSPLAGLAALTVLYHVDEVCSPGRVALIILDIAQQGEHGGTRDERQALLRNM